MVRFKPSEETLLGDFAPPQPHGRLLDHDHRVLVLPRDGANPSVRPTGMRPARVASP